MLTNPRWRKDYLNFKVWKKLAKKGFLYPYVKRFRIDRVNLLAKREEDIWDFYTKTLGMQPKRFIVPTDSKDSYFLFSAGQTQIAIHCLNEDIDIPLQSITITFDNIDLFEEEVQNIPTLRKIDIFNYDEVCSPELREDMDKYGKQIY